MRGPAALFLSSPPSAASSPSCGRRCRPQLRPSAFFIVRPTSVFTLFCAHPGGSPSSALWCRPAVGSAGPPTLIWASSLIPRSSSPRGPCPLLLGAPVTAPLGHHSQAYRLVPDVVNRVAADLGNVVPVFAGTGGVSTSTWTGRCVERWIRPLCSCPVKTHPRLGLFRSTSECPFPPRAAPGPGTQSPVRVPRSASQSPACPRRLPRAVGVQVWVGPLAVGGTSQAAQALRALGLTG